MEKSARQTRGHLPSSNFPVTPEQEMWAFQGVDGKSHASEVEMLLKDLTMERSVRLFVDGLDELEFGDASNVMEFLRSIHGKKSPHDVKICVSSRLDSRDKDVFIHSGDLHLYLHHENHHDLSRFLDHRLDMAGCHGSEAMRRSIVEKAEGSFVWVELVLQHLECRLCAHEDRMDELDHLPLGLDDLFCYILRFIGQHGLGRQPPMLEVMSLVLIAMRPLSDLELYDLSSITSRSGVHWEPWTLLDGHAESNEMRATNFGRNLEALSGGLIMIYARGREELCSTDLDVKDMLGGFQTYSHHPFPPVKYAENLWSTCTFVDDLLS